ncbi:MAG: metal-dependent hydrolase, partial [Myxococcota bacterium]
DPVQTHLANGLNLVFPWGERFFVRSVNHYRDQIDDETLLAQIRGFFGQEGSHAREHEAMMRVLEEQGFDLESFLQFYRRSASFIERRTPPSLRLAITAALEHFTATLGERALTLDHLDHAHPAMRTLLKWHAAEEIEHKAVAFDVLQKVAPSYRLRLLGLGFATTLLLFYWAVATTSLLRQDDVRASTAVRRMKEIREREPIGREVFLKGILDYVRRDFHPFDHDNIELAKAHLAQERLAPAAE